MLDKDCRVCGRSSEFGEPDPCLGGYLPGIAHACCGHGVEKRAYCCGWDGCKPNQKIKANGLKFNPETSCYEIVSNRPGYWHKRGKEAIEYMKSLKPK